MVRPGRVSAVLGVPVGDAEVDRWLRALQLVPVGDGRWSVPSWRRDLTREIDCIEEIARLRGYDTIPVRPHPAGIGETAAISPQRRVTAQARAALSAHGFDEALNYSFLPEKDLAAVSPQPPLRVANPLTAEQGAMRTTLLAGLLRNVGYNLARGVHDLKLYELGRVYLPEPDARNPSGELAWPTHEPRAPGPRAQRRAAGQELDRGRGRGGFLRSEGQRRGRAGGDGNRRCPVRARRAPRASSRQRFEPFGRGRKSGCPGPGPSFGRGVFRHSGADVRGRAGLGNASLPGRCAQAASGVPKFPAVARDLAFVVEASVPAEKLLAEIRSADAAKLLEQVTLFDVYRGPPVPEGRKSVAFGLSLRAPDRTLTDAEADALCAAIRDRLKESVGAEIRA